jgi:hypothetical protein
MAPAVPRFFSGENFRSSEGFSGVDISHGATAFGCDALRKKDAFAAEPP